MGWLSFSLALYCYLVQFGLKTANVTLGISTNQLIWCWPCEDPPGRCRRGSIPRRSSTNSTRGTLFSSCGVRGWTRKATGRKKDHHEVSCYTMIMRNRNHICLLCWPNYKHTYESAAYHTPLWQPVMTLKPSVTLGRHHYHIIYCWLVHPGRGEVGMSPVIPS